MASDLSADTLIRLAISDFEAAWGALAAVRQPTARANFMFGKQAMVVLELAARACASDLTGAALTDFASQLDSRDSRYLTVLPGAVWAPSARTRQAFRLPARSGDDPETHLLAAIFNLVRNGQAHQYQQMRAVLSDKTEFCVQLTGADRPLGVAPPGSADRKDHLSHWTSGADIWIKVRPDVLFVDLRDAVRGAQLEQRSLTLRYLIEGGKTFAFGHSALKSVLANM